MLERVLITVYVEGDVLWDFFSDPAWFYSKRDKASVQSEIYHCNLATIYIRNYLRNRKFPRYASFGMLDSDSIYRNIEWVS